MRQAKTDEISPPAFSRRKAPQQRRSLQTVKNIQQATIELAEVEGFLNLGTRRIAEKAGVSIGSLYQYFPTLEAILLTIYEDVASHVSKEIRSTMLNLMHADMETLGRATLQLLLKEYEKNQLVLHRMPIEVPKLLQAPGAASLDRLLRVSLRIYFMQFGKLSDKDVERISFFLEIVIMGSLRNYLANKPPQLSRKQFLEDLTRILVAYVR